MISFFRDRISGFTKRHPLLSPALTRFPVPETFWNAGTRRVLLRLANYYITYSQMFAKADKVFGYPTHLTLDVTNICNLKCPLCPTGVGAPGRKKGMMPLTTYKKIIDEIGTYLVSIDLFNWGEPLLNRDVSAMIAYAHSRHIVTSLSSNFQHFSEAAAEQLISSGLDILILSIDGASQESYEKYRVGGNFRQAIDHISLLVKKKRDLRSAHPHICWQFLVMRHNEHEVEAAKKMAAELGVDSITIDHAYLPVAAREEALKWLPQDPNYHRYDLAELEKGWQALEKEQDIRTASDRRQSPADTRERPGEDIHAHNNFQRRVNCSWLWTQATINWDGSVAPCCAVYEPSFDFGSISGASFKKVWNNEMYRASRRFSSRGETGSVTTVCMQCPLAKHG
jgi:radical SAM protein with 4Fe4S-binding SPASM domain